jgi:NADH-quinone oxidoreductase subunit M
MNIYKMRGFASKMPYTAISSLLGFLTISGLPPTIGIISKTLVLMGLADLVFRGGSMSLGSILMVITASIAGFGLTIAYSFITMKRIFFGEPGEEEVSEVSLGAVASITATAVTSVAILVIASLIVNPLSSAVTSIIPILLR